MNWGNVYQSIQQAQNMQNMEFIPANNLPQMNNMNQMTNPMDQILFMANNFQNQNIPQMNMGGNSSNSNNNFIPNKPITKINLCFSTLKGARINMTFDANVTVDEALTKFLKRVNLENRDKKEILKLNFILSAETLKFGDHRKIKDIISIPSSFSTVLVHDTQNLIGA